MAIKETIRFKIGDLIEASFPPYHEPQRFVVADVMANGVDVYYSDETGFRGSTARIGRYNLISHDPATTKRIKAIDRHLKQLEAERDRIIANRLEDDDDIFSD
jgi:hypothetical protein